MAGCNQSTACTQVAFDILKKAAQAMDAAIAANAVLRTRRTRKLWIARRHFCHRMRMRKQKNLYGFNGSGRAPNHTASHYFMTRIKVYSIRSLPVLFPELLMVGLP